MHGILKFWKGFYQAEVKKDYLEKKWGNKSHENFIQYKYLFNPIYKSTGGRYNPIRSTLTTFAASTIFHWLPMIPVYAVAGNNVSPALFLLSGLGISAIMYMGSGFAIASKKKDNLEAVLKQATDDWNAYKNSHIRLTSENIIRDFSLELDKKEISKLEDYIKKYQSETKSRAIYPEVALGHVSNQSINDKDHDPDTKKSIDKRIIKDIIIKKESYWEPYRT